MSKSPIPRIEDIRGMTSIPVFEVAGNLEWMDGPVLVGNNDLESVMDFAKAVEAKAILVQYDYPDFDDYFLDEFDVDVIDLFGEDMEEEILDAIDAHNDEFEDYLEKDYDNEAFGCSVYVMYEGVPYGMFVADDLLIEEFGESGEEFLVRKLIDSYEEDE